MLPDWSNTLIFAFISEKKISTDFEKKTFLTLFCPFFDRFTTRQCCSDVLCLEKKNLVHLKNVFFGAFSHKKKNMFLRFFSINDHDNVARLVEYTDFCVYL